MKEPLFKCACWLSRAMITSCGERSNSPLSGAVRPDQAEPSTGHATRSFINSDYHGSLPSLKTHKFVRLSPPLFLSHLPPILLPIQLPISWSYHSAPAISLGYHPAITTSPPPSAILPKPSNWCLQLTKLRENQHFAWILSSLVEVCPML
jgi:hypothetical protein